MQSSLLILFCNLKKTQLFPIHNLFNTALDQLCGDWRKSDSLQLSCYLLANFLLQFLCAQQRCLRKRMSWNVHYHIYCFKMTHFSSFSKLANSSLCLPVTLSNVIRKDVLKIKKLAPRHHDLAVKSQIFTFFIS